MQRSTARRICTPSPEPGGGDSDFFHVHVTPFVALDPRVPFLAAGTGEVAPRAGREARRLSPEGIWVRSCHLLIIALLNRRAGASSAGRQKARSDPIFDPESEENEWELCTLNSNVSRTGWYDSDIDSFVGTAVKLAKKHGVSVADVIAAARVLEVARTNNLYVANGETFDEQVAGVGEELQKISAAIESLKGET